MQKISTLALKLREPYGWRMNGQMDGQRGRYKKPIKLNSYIFDSSLNFKAGEKYIK